MAMLITGCSSHPKPLLDAPTPGITGHVRFSTDDNSTTERVTYTTGIAEPALRLSFENYCRSLGLKRDPRAGTTGIDWWQSDHEYLGILVSPNPREAALVVTYFYNHENRRQRSPPAENVAVPLRFPARDAPEPQMIH